MLQAVDQSWALLGRERKPDLKSLALLRALQAQIHAALGEAEVSDQRIEQLAQLLDARQNELDNSPQGADRSPELYTLACWLTGYNFIRRHEREQGDATYSDALSFAEAKRLAPELIWVIRTQLSKQGRSLPAAPD